MVLAVRLSPKKIVISRSFIHFWVSLGSLKSSNWAFKWHVEALVFSKPTLAAVSHLACGKSGCIRRLVPALIPGFIFLIESPKDIAQQSASGSLVRVQPTSVLLKFLGRTSIAQAMEEVDPSRIWATGMRRVRHPTFSSHGGWVGHVRPTPSTCRRSVRRHDAICQVAAVATSASF